MATFTPFMQSSEAQNIISNYLGGNYNTTSTTPFRNPKFDLRTEQEAAGTLDSSALFPNPQMDFSVADTSDTPVDPCLPGYQLIDGVCQPIENFGQSSYDPSGRTDDDPEERPYMSIEDMKKASDEDLLEYLQDGWLKGDINSSTIAGNWMPLAFQLPFGKQNTMRRNFIINELKRRGYYTGEVDGKPYFDLNPSNKMKNYETLLQEQTGQNFNQAVDNIVNKQNILGQEIAQDDSYEYYTPTTPVDTSGSSLLTNDNKRDEDAYKDAIQQNIVNSLQSETSNYSPFLGGFTGGR
jgi:hypothetical protein